ncbi:hypothetical protein BCR44DRAFT_33806 [Catenaria anguillulae PL171]|uniref:Ankyrin repeat-containing domain protein n=1 Tax=Catenaria anguillulae PL171 TaxID=765915 RepID=A0A1Y2HMZ4_9FUNG|nr:hypothetical protein BCR44DRAFT_33806 [Catenaria anguillulae PL171]
MAAIPTLPLHLIDGILIFAARPLPPDHKRPSSTALLNILQVLPPSLLRSTFCSVIRTANDVIHGPSTPSNELPDLTFAPFVLNNNGSDPTLLEGFTDTLVPILKWEKRICTAFVYQLCVVGRLDLLQRLRAGLVKHQQPGSVGLGDLFEGTAGAVRNGHMDILQWWHAHDPLPMALVVPIACGVAAETGWVQLLQWCFKVDEDFRDHVDTWNIEQCLFDALTGEHIQVLDWWLKLAKSGSLMVDELPFPTGVWAHLCAQGKLKSLEWLNNNDIPFDQLNTPSHDCVDAASENGHTDILQWWLTSRSDFAYTPDAMDKASTNGHLDTLIWWAHSGKLLSFSPLGRNGALSNLHLDVVQWWDRLPLFAYLSGASDAHPKSFLSMDTRMVTSFGRLDLLWTMDNSLWDMETLFMTACRHGQLHVLELYRERIQEEIGDGWSIWILNGICDTRVMQWCLHNVASFFTEFDAEGQAFWNEQLVKAAGLGSTELVDWIFTFILKSDAVPLSVVAAACAKHHVNVLELLLQRHGLRETVDAWASGNQTDPHPLWGIGDVSVLEWWEQNGLPKP